MKIFLNLLLVFWVSFSVTCGNPGADSTTWRWKPKTPKITKNLSLKIPSENQDRANVIHSSGNWKAENCGTVPDQSLEIVNGNEAVPHSYPWQAALYIDESYFCGGALISDEWVLTAGHCTTESNSIKVVLGAHDLTKNEPTQITIESSGADIITHEEYVAIFLSNDIGLVHLSEKINFTSAIQPICLPTASDPDLGPGVLLTATGWGLQSDAENASGSSTLYEVTNPSITNDECAEVYGLYVTEYTICTDTQPNNQGICTGDSGGPLNYVVDGRTYSRGITSFVSFEGCEVGLPDGFVRTNHFLDWISTKTGIIIDP